jgi:hypothetical protein
MAPQHAGRDADAVQLRCAQASNGGGVQQPQEPTTSSWQAAGMQAAVSSRDMSLLPDSAAPPPELPHLPAALCSAAACSLRVALPADTQAHYRLLCGVPHCGEFMAPTLSRGASTYEHVITFPASNAVGVALLALEAIPGFITPPSALSGYGASAAAAPAQQQHQLPQVSDAGVHAGGSAGVRALLLTPNADIAAEVASLPLPATPAEAADAAKLVSCLGHALRYGAAAPPPLVLAATRACLGRGWLATAAALLPFCPATSEPAAEAGSKRGSFSSSRGAPTLIHAALCAPAPAHALVVVLNSLSPGALADAAAAAWGCSSSSRSSADAVLPLHSVTPLHLAAAHPRADVSLELVELLLSRFPGVAHAAWVSKDAAGRSPADVSFAAHPGCARLRQLDAVLCADVSVAAARVATAGRA